MYFYYFAMTNNAYPIMKKIAFAFMAAVLFIACNKEEYGDANLHIKGNIKGLSQGRLYIKNGETRHLLPWTRLL